MREETYMAKCAYCGADTVLYINNVPVCLDCDEKLSSKASSAVAGAGAESGKGPQQPER